MRDKKIKPQMALYAGAASLITVSLLIVIKLWAYLESGSTSVLASLIDSVLDAGVSLMMFLAIRMSLKPADEDHRHGHGKVEGLVALFQALLISGACVFLIMESVSRFTEQSAIVHHGLVIAVMAVSAVMSVILVMIQRYVLRYAPSLAVEADKAHFSMDILVNVGVIGVVVALYMGAPVWIDPLYATGIVVYLAMTVRKIAGDGLDMLLDRELSGSTREKITKKILSHEEVLGFHDLRTHKSGMKIFISFDMEVEPDLILCHAHKIARDVEHEILEDFPNAEILIHLDPKDDLEDTRHSVRGVHDK